MLGKKVGYNLNDVTSSAIKLYDALAPGCDKIVIVLTTDCANTLTAFGGQYGAGISASMIDYKNKIYNIRKMLLSEFQNNTSRPKARVMMLGGTIDRYYGYGLRQSKDPYYSNNTEMEHYDSKHPNIEGQKQGAMTLLGDLKFVLS